MESKTNSTSFLLFTNPNIAHRRCQMGLDPLQLQPEARNQRKNRILEPFAVHHSDQPNGHGIFFLIPSARAVLGPRPQRQALHRHREVASIFQRIGLELAQKLEPAQYFSASRGFFLHFQPFYQKPHLLDQGRDLWRIVPLSQEPLRKLALGQKQIKFR